MQVGLQSLNGVFTKLMYFEHEGEVHAGEAHIDYHTTLLAYGRIAVVSNGRTSEYEWPTLIPIPAEVVHELICRSPFAIVICIHRLELSEDAGDIIDVTKIPAGTPQWSRLFKPLTRSEARAIIERRNVQLPAK